MNLLSFLPSPYAELGIAGCILIAGIGGNIHGHRAEANARDAKEATLAKRIDAAREKLVGKLQAQDQALAAADGERRNIVREITREVPTIINRTVYAGQCIDADGLRVLTRATAAANGERETGAGVDAAAGPLPAANRD